MKNIIIIDIDTNRDETILITKPEEYQQTNSYEKQLIVDMVTMCEGIYTLIRVAENKGIKPSPDSLRDCIKHIENGVMDADYKAY